MKQLFKQTALLTFLMLMLHAAQAQPMADRISDSAAIKTISRSIAVIPMQYGGSGSEGLSKQMSFQLQQIAIDYLHNSPAGYKVLDARHTNALLAKNGITDDDIRSYTPSELAKILGVDYVLTGDVMQQQGKVVTHRNGNSKDKYEGYNHYGHGHGGKHSERYHETVTSSQQTETRVSLAIYTASGEMIYSKSRKSLLSEADGYRNTIRYLLKRTVFGKGK